MGFTAQSARTRLTTAFGLFVVLVFTLAVMFPGTQPAYGQGDAPAADKDAAPKAETGTPKDAPRQSTSLFWHIVRSAGPFFGPLLLIMSIGLVALIVLLAMDLRMGVAIPPGFVEDFTDTVNKRRFKEAFEMSRNDNSFLARVLTAGMGRLQYGIEDSREASMNMVESIKASKDQLVTYLATVGTLGPLLGLVGTVFGMIKAFMELSSGDRPDPQRLADAISHALVITMLGIGIAVPAVFCHALFRNRLTRISMDTSNIADDLLTQMYHNSKRPGAPASPAGPTPPAPPVPGGGQAAIQPAR
jgi:biopolymer transport protein ExbB